MSNSSSKPAQPPHRPLRWGIVGASNIAAEWIIPAIRAQGADRVVAVLSSSAARAAEFANCNDIPRHGADRDAFFGDPDIDAVYVSTTNERHAEDTISAAQVGKHVLCEKPMALDQASALGMIEACRRAGVVLAVNHHMRCMETHRAIREIVRGGELGRLTLVRVLFGIGLTESAMRWRVGEGATGGGAMFDLAAHDVDLLRFLLDDDIDQVSCMVDAGDVPSAAEHTSLLAIRMKSGLLATTAESFSTPGARTSLEIHGTKGSLVAHDVMLQAGIGTIQLQLDAERRDVAVEHSTPYVRVVREFGQAVRGEGDPAATGGDGLLSLLAVLTAKESASTGLTIKLPSIQAFSGNRT